MPIFATTFTGRIVLEPEHFPDTPWMALPLSVREQIARRVEPSEPTLVEHQPWHKYSDTPLAHGSQIIGKVGKDCWEDVVLRIHWSEGTNEEISSAFRKWITKYLKTHARIQPPKGKRPGVNKAWLKRLGGMRLWRAGAGLEGARDIAERHIAAEDSAARKQGITRPKDPQLTNPISERADEDSMREDISRVSRDLRHLFVRGLYRYVRNPMYLSVTMIILGEALVAHSVALAVYWAVWFVCANLFVIVYEEPTLRQRFGESYDEYTQRVGRWIPKFHCSQIR